MQSEQHPSTRRFIGTRVTAVLGACCLLVSCSDRPTRTDPTTSTSSSTASTSSTGTSSPPVVNASGVDPAAWRPVDTVVTRAGGQVALLAAQVTESGQLRIVHRTGPTQVRPIASVAKLYVMVALLDALGSGKARWDQQLTLRGEDIAGGSGLLAGQGRGARVTVQEAARLMFAESDNTATSLLIRTLGQPALMTALRESGHSAPDRMSPFLTVREDLWLLYSSSPAAARARAVWPGASVTERTRLIAAARTTATDFGVPPAWRSGLGYVASAQDVARAWAVIATRVNALKSQVASSVMTVRSPGFTRPAAWSTVWFKSGALDSVRAGTWFAPGRDGRPGQVVVVLAADGPGESGVASLGAAAAEQLDRYSRSSASAS